MESQEINPEKDKASDAQIMFMCLHASGLTLIATSIIGIELLPMPVILLM
jgi:spore maturation protein SpmA